uniref:Myotubularin related protein 11 n=1 Tax=Scleropages formosus TaxID=113540 RepID=A0A8C9VAE3_SCLFO
MLTGSKTTFKVRQLVPDVKGRMQSHGGLHVRGRDHFGLQCLPGECVLQRAVLVRKKLSAAEGGGWLAGTLFCTHFRVAFVAQDSKKPDDSADPVLFGDHDVALASIEKVVAVGPSRTKLVTPSTSLKFTPEELVVYCRDLRVLCFLFDRLTPETQAVEITYAIAKTYQPMKPGSILSFQNSALGSVEMRQFLSNRRQDCHMNWFETAADWEKELERTRAMGWRVSAVNDRFEMATSLPRFNVVPQKVLDTELKKTFAHFNEGRIPRWCWHHPCGSDLLRMASLQNNIYHEKDDIRNLEAIVFGVQQQCVVVDVAEEMPTPADIQLAHTRLRALCLGGSMTILSCPVLSPLLASTPLHSTHRCCLKKAAEVACLLRERQLSVILQEPEDRDMNCVVSSLVQVMSDPYCRTMLGFQGLIQKEWVMAGHRFLSRANYHRDSDKEEGPIFLLFLDCVWQLWAQRPSRFQFTGDYLLALHDSAHVPLFSTFLFNCQRERSRRSQRLTQSYTPVDGWSEGPPEEASQHPSDPPFPPVWDWALQYSPRRRACFTQPVTQPILAAPAVLNGNLNLNDAVPGSVFLFSRGSFTSPSHLLPWRSGGGVGSYRKSHRRAPSSESLPGLDRLLKAYSLLEVCRTPSSPHDPQEPLLPLLLGPCVGVWKECYLRGALHAQAWAHPSSTSSPFASASTHHPVDQLAQEVQQLRDKLAQVSFSRAASKTNRQQFRRPEANLNRNASSGTFLFSASRPAQVTPRAIPPTSSLPKAPLPKCPITGPAHRDAGKRTFLFGSTPNGRADLRYTPTPSVRLAKNSGSSLKS